MADSGLIKEFTVVLEPKLLGKNLIAFMFLTLKKPNKNVGFLNMIENEPDVLACYYLTGDFDYMIQIVTKDEVKLEGILSKIKSTQEVARTRTIIALSTKKEKHSVAP
jgi:Lrp/AsnC family leucine-responsive transcriptional regulator